jgi:hypothetical protein
MALGMAAILFAAQAARAEAAADDAALCAAAIVQAARLTGVPQDILTAIARVESGHRGQPWPWAINQNGDGHWHPSREALLSHIGRLRAAGADSFDIGCFQINTRWHAHAFESDAAMADPGANALHAARFLAALRDEFGTWEAATGAFHSRTPALAAA